MYFIARGAIGSLYHIRTDIRRTFDISYLRYILKHVRVPISRKKMLTKNVLIFAFDHLCNLHQNATIYIVNNGKSV